MASATKRIPRQVSDMVGMARLAEWRRLKITVEPGPVSIVSIVADTESFVILRELALVLEAELTDGRFVAEYEGGVTLEIVLVRPVGTLVGSVTRATYRTDAGSRLLHGRGALVKWGPRWKEGYLLAQFNDPLRSEAGAELWTGWHEFASQDFVFHA